MTPNTTPDTKRERRLAARDDRKRRAVVAQKRAKAGRLVAILIALALVATLAVVAFTTSLFGLMTPSIGRAMPQERADHVPDGSPLTFGTRPPTSGAHYAAWYPSYGVVDQEVSPGNWVHNLEHGAIVLLYNCPGGCPELVSQLREMHPTLPRGKNARRGVPRMLAIPYADMDRRIAVIAWGRILELDELDQAQILQFYEAYLDRGPECQAGTCPD